MDNAFKKVNFVLWVKIAVYASAPSEKIYIEFQDKSFMGRRRKRLNSMFGGGYLERELINEKTGYCSFAPTQKFKDEFKDKYKEVSKKIRPDFTDEIRIKMLNAFKF
jgi:hypothetical protein